MAGAFSYRSKYLTMKSVRGDEIRRAAIDHHHDVASVFESAYERMATDRFADAFAYGRHKIDVVLENELKRLSAGAQVLDVGCGTGVYLRRFLQLGFTPTGVEPAPAMLAAARRDNPGATVEEGVATSLPIPDATFDFVTSIEVLRYLSRDDTRVALAECHRVLKPGGILFVTMVNRWALDGFYVLQRARQLRLRKDFDRKHPHCEFFTPAELREALEYAALVNVRTVGRLAAPMRAAYKVSAGLAARIARRIEAFDDLLHELPVTTAFAGHLIAIGERPR